MLNLFQQLRGSPKRSPSDKTRQQTIESAFSRVTVRNTPKDTSTTPSLTTATSLTDTSSELADESPNVDNRPMTSRRARFVDHDSKNTPLISKSLVSPQRAPSSGGTRQISGETLVAGRSESQERLLQEGVQALDESWDLGAMPGDDLEPSGQATLNAKQSNSSRPDLLKRASSVTKKVLGKRRRETFEESKEESQASRSEKRSSIRNREPKTPHTDGPSQKRARFSGTVSKKQDSPEPQIQQKATKKTSKSKRWLQHGLYAGQHLGFEARLTETQNKKKGKAQQEQVDQSSIMPKPMYTGQEIVRRGRDFMLPFDVFSPLPAGQPKPDEWKKTQKSMGPYLCSNP